MAEDGERRKQKPLTFAGKSTLYFKSKFSTSYDKTA